MPHYLGGLLGLQGLTLAGLYWLGIVVAVIAAKTLKRTVLRGNSPPFLMELPSYKWPSLRTVLIRVMDRASSFLRLAGTMILAVSILVWACALLPPSQRDDRPCDLGPKRESGCQAGRPPGRCA